MAVGRLVGRDAGGGAEGHVRHLGDLEIGLAMRTGPQLVRRLGGRIQRLRVLLRSARSTGGIRAALREGETDLSRSSARVEI